MTKIILATIAVALLLVGCGGTAEVHGNGNATGGAAVGNIDFSPSATINTQNKPQP